MTVWVLGWNQPGKLPDDEPLQFTSWDEATARLVQEVSGYWMDYDRELTEFLAASMTMRLAPKDQPFAMFYGDRVWWIADLVM